MYDFDLIIKNKETEKIMFSFEHLLPSSLKEDKKCLETSSQPLEPSTSETLNVDTNTNIQ
ncbi:MAG: hypothetical protein J6A25_04955 [Lachnospiraceae bacterium]|nr:hypothetical protein [Lachnospiraceae bacterium]MBP3906765.1 hypothetical protein [Peptostreptococcaceae bacterium]